MCSRRCRECIMGHYRPSRDHSPGPLHSPVWTHPSIALPTPTPLLQRLPPPCNCSETCLMFCPSLTFPGGPVPRAGGPERGQQRHEAQAAPPAQAVHRQVGRGGAARAVSGGPRLPPPPVVSGCCRGGGAGMYGRLGKAWVACWWKGQGGRVTWSSVNRRCWCEGEVNVRGCKGARSPPPPW